MTFLALVYFKETLDASAEPASFVVDGETAEEGRRALQADIAKTYDDGRRADIAYVAAFKSPDGPCRPWYVTKDFQDRPELSSDKLEAKARKHLDAYSPS